jgi:hypothetical protein
MFCRVWRGTLLVVAAGLLLGAWGQRGGGSGRKGSPSDDPDAARSSATGDIGRAKADRDQNIKDATRLAELAEKVRQDLVAGSSFTLSLATLKDTDEINRLSKKLYARLKTGNPRPDPAANPYDATHVGPPKE